MSKPYEPRSIKAAPFCWGEKEALRMIHGAFSETDNLPSGYAVYTALTMIASDEQSETFTVRKALIAFKAGVSIRTAGDVLKRLEAMRLVGVVRHSTTGTTPDGASTYTLLQVGNGCTGVSNGCAPVGNQPERSLIADKVEESKKNLSEETLSPLSASPQTAGKGEKAKKPKAAKSETPADPRFQAVTDGYCTAYLDTFHSPYVHTGGRDGQRLKQFLATAKSADFTAERIVKIARAAMKRSTEPFAKAAKFATSLHSFCDNFNPIRAELIAQTGVNGHGKPHSEQAVDLRDTCDPADFTAWLRRTFPKADPDLTPHTATHEIILQYVAHRPTN